MTDDKGKGSTELMTDIRKEDELGPVDFFDMLFFKTFLFQRKSQCPFGQLVTDKPEAACTNGDEVEHPGPDGGIPWGGDMYL